tara:strand:+ start:738 stop:1508 length:771 start_codon:yes stop_codon:yes gene_type:complete
MIFNLGIGDILLTRMIFDTIGIEKEFNIYKPIIDQYREGSEEYLNFVIKLSKTLFGENSGKVISHREPLFNNTSYEIGDVKLSKYFNLKNTLKEPYIVFHTKARFDYQKNSEYFKKNDLPIFTQFLRDFKTDKKIIILGEREISSNYSTSLNNQFLIYKELQLLKNKNKVFDFTTHTLNNKPDWKTFERDMSYIQYADLNVGVGYGGNMVSCFAFSRKICFFLSRIQHPLLKYFNEYIHNTLETYLEEIKKEHEHG